MQTLGVKRKILMVDDEVKILDVVKSYLETKDYEVFTAETGTKALALLERYTFSMVLLDLMLPDLPGEELCMSIRKCSRIPVIMLTAKNQEQDQLTGLQIGADDYIVKPFSLKTLHARIETVLRRVSGSDGALYSRMEFNGGELAIDFLDYTVNVRGTPVNLTPNEFKLLAALAKYPTKVFTRDELIQITFGPYYDALDRTIDSHIKNLRRKIEKDPRTPQLVLTVHGIGYKFGGT